MVEIQGIFWVCSGRLSLKDAPRCRLIQVAAAALHVRATLRTSSEPPKLTTTRNLFESEVHDSTNSLQVACTDCCARMLQVFRWRISLILDLDIAGGRSKIGRADPEGATAPYPLRNAGFQPHLHRLGVSSMRWSVIEPSPAQKRYQHVERRPARGGLQAGSPVMHEGRTREGAAAPVSPVLRSTGPRAIARRWSPVRGTYSVACSAFRRKFSWSWQNASESRSKPISRSRWSGFSRITLSF